MMFSPPRVLILLSFLFLYTTAQDVESFRLILTDLILPDYIPTQVFYFFPNCDINQNRCSAKLRRPTLAACWKLPADK